MGKVCKSKKKGGFGIKDIRKMNMSLLCKWWWKLETESGLWQEIVTHKYLQGRSVCTVNHRQSDSPIWSDMLKVKDIYLHGRCISVKNGQKTLFWQDSWRYGKPLCVMFPELYKLCEQKNLFVHQVIKGEVRTTFCRR